VGYAGAEDSSCVLLSEITGMSNYFREEVVSEAKGYTCAQFKIAYPRKSFYMSFDLEITTDRKHRIRELELLRCFENVAGRRFNYFLVLHVINGRKASYRRDGDYWTIAFLLLLLLLLLLLRTVPVSRRYVLTCL